MSVKKKYIYIYIYIQACIKHPCTHDQDLSSSPTGLYIYIYIYTKRCPLSFPLNTGIVLSGVVGKKPGACRLARCQLRAQAQTYLWVGGFLVLSENQGRGEGRFCHFG